MYQVSVVLATYSPQMFKHLQECIESLRNQTYRNVEIICIVDGNREYYKKVKDEFPDVEVYLNDKNYGLLYSRNRGVSLSSGEIVAFIDDDAVADRKWIEELVRMYEEYDAIAAGGRLEPLWLVKKPKWLPEEFYWMIGVTHLGFPEKITEVRNTFGSNLSFRRDIFLELRGFNLDMGGIKGKKMLQGGETELCERMRQKYGKGVMYNPNAVVYHKIFERRVKFGFLVRRAFWQGYSKSIMEDISGGIIEERGFLRYLLGERVLKRLKSAMAGNSDELLKAVMLVGFTAVVGFGYIWGWVRE